jgi:hypothetical protein
LGLFGLFGGKGSNAPRKGRFLTAVDTIEALRIKTGLRATGKAGVVFNPSDDKFFEKLGQELANAFHGNPAARGVRFDLVDDAYSSRWVVLEDRDLSRLATSVLLVDSVFAAKEFRKRLLAAILQVEFEGAKAYWIYSYKRERFHPFIPVAEKKRDSKAEMRLGELMSKEKVALEGTLELWYALWGIPF